MTTTAVSTSVYSYQQCYTTCGRSLKGPRIDYHCKAREIAPIGSFQLMLTTVQFPPPYRGWVSNQEGLEITDGAGKKYTFEGKGDFQIKFEPGKPIQITKNQHHCLPILQPKMLTREELLVLWQGGKRSYKIDEEISIDDYIWLVLQSETSNTTSNAPSVTAPKENAPAKRPRLGH